MPDVCEHICVSTVTMLLPFASNAAGGRPAGAIECEPAAGCLRARAHGPRCACRLPERRLRARARMCSRWPLPCCSPRAGSLRTSAPAPGSLIPLIMMPLPTNVQHRVLRPPLSGQKDSRSDSVSAAGALQGKKEGTGKLGPSRRSAPSRCAPTNGTRIQANGTRIQASCGKRWSSLCEA